MKIVLTSLLGMLYSLSFAQLTADAGEYKTACKSWVGLVEIELGGNPAAFGGTPPYTYTWEAYHENTIGSNTFQYFASSFLDDTTAANPTLVNFPAEQPVMFNLTVVDSDGNEATSYTIIRHSMFYLHLGNITYNVEYGDSVFHNFGANIGGGIEPYQEVIWRPNDGLIDSTLMNGFWIKPETSQQYYVTITDAGGCTISGGTMIYVNVGYANLLVDHLQENLMYPNPSSSTVSVTFPEQIKATTIYDAMGRQILESTSLPLDISGFPSGIYWIHFADVNGSVRIEKLTRK